MEFLEGHVWLVHALTWSHFCFGTSSWRVDMWRLFLLLFLEGLSWRSTPFYYFICMHEWTTCYFGMVVMEHSPRRIIILFSYSCILEGALSEPSYVDLGAHPPMSKNIILYFACMHLGGCIVCGPFGILTW